MTTATNNAADHSSTTSSLPKPDVIILVIMVIRVGNPTNEQKTIWTFY